MNAYDSPEGKAQAQTAHLDDLVHHGQQAFMEKTQDSFFNPDDLPPTTSHLLEKEQERVVFEKQSG